MSSVIIAIHVSAIAYWRRMIQKSVTSIRISLKIEQILIIHLLAHDWQRDQTRIPNASYSPISYFINCEHNLINFDQITGTSESWAQFSFVCWTWSRKLFMPAIIKIDTGKKLRRKTMRNQPILMALLSMRPIELNENHRMPDQSKDE